jgi:hypothetical protein
MPVWKLADSKGMEAAAAALIVTRSTATVHPIRPAMIPARCEACAGLRTNLKQDLRVCVRRTADVWREHAYRQLQLFVCARRLAISERGVLSMFAGSPPGIGR